MILAGDIGGTKTNLAIFDESLVIVQGTQRKYPSHEHRSLEEVLTKYRAEVKHEPAAAGFGIAGPVKEGVCRATNLPWEVHADSLAKLLNVKRVALVNDLVANAAGIDVLPAGSIETLQAGRPEAHGNRAILSAGTGLGQAAMVWDEQAKRYVPVPSEGGHGDFAPRTELQVELWRYLTYRFGRAEWEQILSGPGSINCYEFFRDFKKMEEPAALRNMFLTMDRAAAIGEAARAGGFPIADAATELFVSCYGAQAGNVGLGVLATNGVYLGGGIAPKNLEKLKSPHFLEAFLDKGKMRGVMEQMPVRVIMNPDTALYGAAALTRA